MNNHLSFLRSLNEYLIQAGQKKKAICTILTLVFLSGLAFSGYQIYKQLHEYDKGKSVYTDLDVYMELPSPEETKGAPDENQSESGETEESIAQSDDNSYYLKHLFDKSSNSSGCIFLDCRNSPDELCH